MDRFKIYMIHDATNIKGSSVRLTASTVANKEFEICSDESRHTFTQSDGMSRYTSLIPRKELDLPKHVLLRIYKYLYGLS